ncbi:MAG: hypothetical protein ACU84J_01880 [Gammaproteobacteria bacterium]
MDLTNVPVEVIGGAVIGVPAFWIFITRFAERMINSKVQIEAATAQIQVIKMLQDEIKRLSAVNNRLIVTLQTLQIENTKMRKELTWLHHTTSDMHQKVSTIAMRKDDVPYTGEDRRKHE